MSALKHWIEAVRLRTIPVSISGVLLGLGFAAAQGYFKLIPALLCMGFAILAQVASNFANEYYDYVDGLDNPGREGPRRGVTEGDISPRSMKLATYLTLAAACAVGCALIYYGGWWMLAAGAALACLAIGYSAGPFPLSRHALGEITVIACFGVAPVVLTCYLQTLQVSPIVVLGGVSAGLMGANVLIVNNYRDAEDDRAVGKVTLAVLLGPKLTRGLYCINGIAAMALLLPIWQVLPVWAVTVPAFYLVSHFTCCGRLATGRGRALNPLLGFTSRLMLIVTLSLAVIMAVCRPL